MEQPYLRGSTIGLSFILRQNSKHAKTQIISLHKVTEESIFVEGKLQTSKAATQNNMFSYSHFEHLTRMLKIYRVAHEMSCNFITPLKL